jgi:hypothetical protein
MRAASSTVGGIMKTKRVVSGMFLLATLCAASAFAHDRGPRFAQDRLDTLVAQHAESNRHIAAARDDAPVRNSGASDPHAD